MSPSWHAPPSTAPLGKVVFLWPGAGRKRELGKPRMFQKSTSWRTRNARSSTEPRSNADAGDGVAALGGDPGCEGGLPGDAGDSGIGGLVKGVCKCGVVPELTVECFRIFIIEALGFFSEGKAEKCKGAMWRLAESETLPITVDPKQRLLRVMPNWQLPMRREKGSEHCRLAASQQANE